MPSRWYAVSGLTADKDLEEWTAEEMDESVTFANAVGALVTTRRGAIPAMPTLSEVQELLE